MSNNPVYELLKSSLGKNTCPGTDHHNRTLSLDLVIASLAKNIWKRYNSALALWKTFCKKRGSTGSVKELSDAKRDFILWCWEKRGLAVSTIKVYWAELKNLKFLSDELEKGGGEGLEKSLFRGMENLGLEKKPRQLKTVPLNVETLRSIWENLGRERERLTGQSVWTCCLVALWGAFRLGELLGKVETKFDKFSDLLWKDMLCYG
jgi:hypothetical protein